MKGDPSASGIFEFTVPGPPVSAQAKRKDTREKWKQRVRRAAEECWPEGRSRFPSEDLLTLEVTYFCNDLNSIDVDNIPKPISDALTKLVYDDDKRIIDCIARKRALADDLVIENPSRTLLAELERSRPFLLIIVRRNVQPKLVP